MVPSATACTITMSNHGEEEESSTKSDDSSSAREDNDDGKHGGASLLDTAPPAKNVGRKRTIDESKLNPEEARKLETRRAYNRHCAAKGKVRL